jgi:DNA/RNA endonuclease YhcR with UshA esterase domain
MKKLFFLLIFLFILPAAMYPQTKTSPDSAENYIGSQVTVIGVVNQVHLTKTGNYFLNMGGDFPDNTFTAVIFSSDTSKFSDIKSFEGKAVSVTGTVQSYNDKPEIVINNKDQIKLARLKPE